MKLLPCFYLLTLCLSGAALANDQQRCDGALLDALAAQSGQNDWRQPDEEQAGTLAAAACKPWPDDGRQTVVALAYETSEERNPAEGRSLRLLLGLADTQTGRLTATYSDNEEEDAGWAIDARSLRVDTARYHLAPGVRAFGFVTHSAARGPSCPDFNYNDLLTLVVPDGDRLRPVLRVYLYQWMQTTENTCPNSPDARAESAQITLSLGKETSHGFADIILTADVTGSEGEPRTVKKVLRYDGKQYPQEEYALFWEKKPSAP